MQRKRSFKLTRYLSLTSLLGVLIAAAVLGQLYRGFAQAQITATAERHSLELAQHLVAGIWPEYGDFLVGLGDMNGDQIRARPQLQALHQRLLKQLRDSRIVKVKLFDTSGLTVYSTALDQIGKRKSGYAGFEAALLGQTTSLASYRDSFFNHAENIALRKRELLSSYAPIRNDDGKVAAVVELYNDITPLMNDISRIQAQLVGATIVVMLVLYSTLFYNIRRAERIIEEKALAHAEHQQRMQHQANHDGLTGLPNRRHFRHLLGERMAVAEKQEHLLAVLFIDLDRFKPINDTLGHQAGDDLLKCVAERLAASCRDHDVVSRIGGDEFTVILDRIEHIRHVEAAARRLLDSISQPVQLGGKELSIGASIGIAIYPFDDEDLDALIKHADTAMYAAKDAGRNRYLYYADDMNTACMQRLELERDLRNAIRLDQLELHYQPRFCLRSRRVIGVEALLRWRHPDLGMVPPDVFIPAAEETGLIQSLGNWVLHTGCAQIADLSRQLNQPVMLSLNVSALQLRDDSFHDEIGRALAASGLSSGHLELELTESTLMQNCDDAVATLAGIKDTGVAVALDDFGTGYSSLSYLKRLPLDTLKIDRSFINGVTEDSRDAALAASIVDIGRRLGLRVVAEGIETDAQLAFVRSSGCDEAQGYLIARPMPLHELTRFLSDKDSPRKTG